MTYSVSHPFPNNYAVYVDAHTGEVLHVDRYHSPYESRLVPPEYVCNVPGLEQKLYGEDT